MNFINEKKNVRLINDMQNLHRGQAGVHSPLKDLEFARMNASEFSLVLFYFHKNTH